MNMNSVISTNSSSLTFFIDKAVRTSHIKYNWLIVVYIHGKIRKKKKIFNQTDTICKCYNYLMIRCTQIQTVIIFC